MSCYCVHVSCWGSSNLNFVCSVRWRSSQPPRRVSPLRARENESPRQPGFRSRSELPPPHSDAKRARLDPPAAERDSSGKENTARRASLTAGADAGRFYGSRPMRSPSQSPQRRRPADGGTPARPSASPRKTGEAGKALQLYGGQAQAPVLELVPVNAPDQHKHLSDPLYIGWGWRIPFPGIFLIAPTFISTFFVFLNIRLGRLSYACTFLSRYMR